MAPQLIQSFAGQGVPQALMGPSPVFLTGEESLRVTSFGNAAGVTLQITGRVLRPDNTISPIQGLQTPNSNRTAKVNTFALSEGWLLGYEVRASAGTPASNAVWVLVELVRGDGSAAVAIQALGSDFVSANSPAIYPGGAMLDPLDGAGCLRSITGTTPAAGAEISETVPTAARWELLALRAQLVTSGVASTRQPRLVLDDGTSEYYRGANVDGIGAGTTCVYSWAQGGYGGTTPDAPVGAGPCPMNNRLGPGHRIKTLSTPLLGGDQWSGVQYLVREWFDV